MASQGSKIYATDYNIIQSAIASVLGVGSGTSGYGLTSSTTPALNSSQIIGNPTITTTQWSNLRQDLINAYTHQGSPGSLTIPSVPTRSNKVTASDYALYLALSNACTSNKLAIPPSPQASAVTFSTGTRTTAWNGTITHTVVMTFSDANHARYYFNAGGYITFQASLINYPGYPGYGTADGSYTKNSDWNMLLSNMGTTTFGYNSTTNSGNGTGQTILSNVGYYQLTTSSQNIYRKVTSSSTYTPNQYDIYAYVDGTGAVLTFSIQFQDLSTAHSGNPYSTDWNVEGTLTSLVKGYYASGSYVSVTPPSINSANPTIG